MLSQEVQGSRLTAGEARKEDMEQEERSWRGNCDVSSLRPREMKDYRWKERRTEREIHVGDYGWRLIVGLVGKQVRMFDRHEEDEKEKERNGRSKEDDWGRLTLKRHLLPQNWFPPSVNFHN